MIKRILLADDDMDDRQIFGEALAAIDPQIVYEVATDGKEILSMLSPAHSRPSIIFLDINMPVMSGWEVLKKLKTEAHLNGIPVIIYSTSSGIREKMIAEELGANCFVTKPDSFKQVKSMLEIVITHLEQATTGTTMCSDIQKTLATP